jgi:hypothetical protein
MKSIKWFCFFIVILNLVIGCSRYISGVYPLRDSDQVTDEQLVKAFENLNGFYSGYVVNNPSGILFDPKNDGERLIPRMEANR